LSGKFWKLHAGIFLAFGSFAGYNQKKRFSELGKRFVPGIEKRFVFSVISRKTEEIL
jgi:hypothetical protein